MYDHVSYVLWSPWWLLLSATFHLGMPHPLSWVLFQPHFPIHRSSSSSTSLLIVSLWVLGVRAFCMECSPFTTASTEVLATRFPSWRPLVHETSHGLSPWSWPGILFLFLALTCGKNMWLDLGSSSHRCVYLWGELEWVMLSDPKTVDSHETVYVAGAPEASIGVVPLPCS